MEAIIGFRNKTFAYKQNVFHFIIFFSSFLFYEEKCHIYDHISHHDKAINQVCHAVINTMEIENGRMRLNDISSD